LRGAAAVLRGRVQLTAESSALLHYGGPGLTHGGGPSQASPAQARRYPHWDACRQAPLRGAAGGQRAAWAGSQRVAPPWRTLPLQPKPLCGCQSLLALRAQALHAPNSAVLRQQGSYASSSSLTTSKNGCWPPDACCAASAASALIASYCANQGSAYRKGSGDCIEPVCISMQPCAPPPCPRA